MAVTPLCCSKNGGRSVDPLVDDDFSQNAEHEQAAGNEEMHILKDALELGDGENCDAGQHEDGPGIFEQGNEEFFHCGFCLVFDDHKDKELIAKTKLGQKLWEKIICCTFAPLFRYSLLLSP